jgi:hypothetical protein
MRRSFTVNPDIVVSISLHQVSNIAEHSGAIGQWSARSQESGEKTYCWRRATLSTKRAETWVLNLLHAASQSCCWMDRSATGGLQLVEVDPAVVVFHRIRLPHALLVSRQVCVVESVANRSPLPELVFSLSGYPVSFITPVIGLDAGAQETYIRCGRRNSMHRI